MIAASLMMFAVSGADVRDYDLSCVVIDGSGASSRLELRIGGQNADRRLAVSGVPGTPWAAAAATVVKPGYARFEAYTGEYTEAFQVSARGTPYNFLLSEYPGGNKDDAILRIGVQNESDKDVALGACSGKPQVRPLDVSAPATPLVPLNDFYRTMPLKFDVGYSGRCSVAMTDLSVVMFDLQISANGPSKVVGRITPVQGQIWPAVAVEGNGNFNAITIAARDVPSRSYTFVTQSFVVNTSFGQTYFSVDHKGKVDLETWVEVRRAPLANQNSSIVGAGRCTSRQSIGI